MSLVLKKFPPGIVLILLTLAIACSPTRGCIESNFELAPESRLPVWFSVPATTPRSDVHVALAYWSGPRTDVPTVELVLSAKAGYSMFGGARLYGRSTKHPRSAPGILLGKNRAYEIVDVGGKVDVIEHRAYAEQNRDPTRALFWMCDDPEILREAREIVAAQKAHPSSQ